MNVRLLAGIGAAILCILSLPAWAQDRSQGFAFFKPTTVDVVQRGASWGCLVYGIGVGRDGFTWQGLLQISRKAEWPDWHPPPEMIERQPYLPRFMAGGPGNPLGARAMHLGNTVYRIHGTNAPETIGHAVSSGCFRLVNDDVVDLYTRVPVGTHVIVRQN